MNLTREGVEQLRAMAADAVGKGYEASAFGVMGADLVIALCDGWLRDEAFDPCERCCCGECA